MWKEIIAQVTPMLVTVISTIISAFIIIGMKRINEYIKERVKSERLESALIQVNEAVATTVLDIEAEVRRFMSDGKLTKDEQRILKDMARIRIMNQAQQSLETLTKSGLQNLNDYINGKIEQAVADIPESDGKE